MKSIDEADDNYLEQLTLDAPVMIIQGRHDVFRETHQELIERFPQAKSVWIDEANHFLWLEKPEAFQEALVGFYKD